MASTSKPELVRSKKELENQTLLSFPSVPLPHSILLTFTDYDYTSFLQKTGANRLIEDPNPNKVNRPEPRSEASIELPFPRTLTDSNNLRVNAFERDFLTERAAAGLADFGAQSGTLQSSASRILSIPGNLFGAGSNFMKSIEGKGLEDARGFLADALKSLGGFNTSNALQGAQFLLRNYIPGDILKSASVFNAAAINPNETLAFEGVDLRSFSFSWSLYPSNRQDSEVLRKIITLLKQRTLPKVSKAGLDNLPFINRPFLGYPSIVDLKLIGVSENHWLTFKPCMVTSFSIDYKGAGEMAMLKGGKPAGITLNIDFTELTIWTADDYPIVQDASATGEAQTPEVISA